VPLRPPVRSAKGLNTEFTEVLRALRVKTWKAWRTQRILFRVAADSRAVLGTAYGFSDW